MKILMVGDVTDPSGVQYLKERLWQERKRHGIDFVAVNAENASFIGGADQILAETLLEAGADVLTGGNHTMQRLSIHSFLENDARMLRPLNYPAAVPGRGYTVLDAQGYRVLVLNAMGVVHMEPTLDNPFYAIDRVLDREEGHYDFAILDFHAEAAGEKGAIAHYFDGRIQIIAGTHTHVPTADQQILPKGTGFVTDLGMCGPTGGVLGINADVIIERSMLHLPKKYEAAEGPVSVDGVIFTLDPSAKRVTAIERIKF